MVNVIIILIISDGNNFMMNEFFKKFYFCVIQIKNGRASRSNRSSRTVQIEIERDVYELLYLEKLIAKKN